MTEMFTADITLTVNGSEQTVAVRHHWSLLDVLRDVLGLTGAKRGCDRGVRILHGAVGRVGGERLPGAGVAVRRARRADRGGVGAGW